jgi:hypothetical protein
VGAWTPEPNYDFNAWVTIVTGSYTVRIPLATWASTGPPGTLDIPELLGVTRDTLEAHFLSSNCTGTPLLAPLAWDGTGQRMPGVRNVLIVPVAGTRTVRYYDASTVGYGGQRTAGSRASYDGNTGMFGCQQGFTFPQELTGIGALLFDSTNLPPEPYRIQ